MSNEKLIDPRNDAHDSPQCDEFLQRWLEEEQSAGPDGSDSASEAGQHVASCERCTEEAAAMK